MPKTKKIKAAFDITNSHHLDHLRGLLKVKISPLAQVFIGCRVGENIRIEKPWIFVDKEKFLDHVEFYDKNSEFFPIISSINKFPNEKILIGTYHIDQNEKIKYYICSTLDVENIILRADDIRRKTIRRKTLEAISLDTKTWRTLGSEDVIDCEILKNERPLMVVELEGCMPILKNKTHFVLRNVESIRDGYMELLNNRSSYKSVLRKRIDIGIQTITIKRSVGIQANFVFMCHKSVQCSCEPLSENVKKFSFNLDELNDLLNVNFHINLFTNDYKDLRKFLPKDTMSESTKLKSYQDVINCRRRQISCFSWNAIISGIVAAAHTTTPIFSIVRKPATTNLEFDTVFNEHLVLIWEYKNNVYPKFYLHAAREVTALSFCPYDVNILVAGYSNGQIVVWDLSNRLDVVEPREFRTDVEQNNRALIMKDADWFKLPLDNSHIFPVLCCTFHEGHRDAVTTIGWIPPSKYISSQRTYKDSAKNMPHMQFITASLGGEKILVWDLKIPNILTSATQKKVRLPEVILALRNDTSPLFALKNKFKPVCRMLLKDTRFPVTRILVQRHMYSYVAQNPNTLKDINEPTYFTVSENNAAFDYSSKLYFTTGVGTIHKATWEGTDFDSEHCAINENCTIKKCYNIHDGPIFVCEANPCLPNVVLTIGGSILAIWTLKERKIPIFWRKYHVRCITGMWYFLHPLAFLVLRSDRYYDIWNICEISKAPIKTFKYNGYDLTKLYQDTSRLHVTKNTCVITDIAGAFQLYTVPSDYSNNEFNIKEAIKYLKNLNKMKNNLEILKKNFRSKQTEIEKLPEITVAEPSPVKELQLKVPLQKQKQKKVSFQRILIVEEMRGRKLLSVKAAEKLMKEKKVTKKLQRRDEIFEKAKEELLIGAPSKYEEKSSKGDSKKLKEKYFIEYKKLESEIIEKIKNEPYDVDFNWASMLGKHGKL